MSPSDVAALSICLFIYPSSSSAAATAEPVSSEVYRHLLNRSISNGDVWSLLQPPPLYPPSCSGATPGLSQQQCVAASQCLSAVAVERLVNATSGDPVADLCPALLYQHLIPNCVGTHRPNNRVLRRKPSPLEVWGYGLLFVTFISVSSIFAVILLPLLGKKRFDSLMPSLIGLAAGSLSSSAIFHLIPEAFALTSPIGDHRYLNASLVVLCGAWIFFMLERCMKLVLDYRVRQTGEVSDIAEKIDMASCSTVSGGTSGGGGGGGGGAAAILDTVGGDSGGHLATNDGAFVNDVTVQAIRASFGQVDKKPRSAHQHNHRQMARRHADKGGDAAAAAVGGGARPIATVAWMVICGDSLHNLLDGISIGAAFSENIMTGISVSLAVICEELPHELGDFAVLLESGMTVRQAVFYNFASACTCYVGLVLGVFIGDFTQSANFVFALAAGMFLYISLVDMVPEMNEEAEKASAISLSRGFYVIFVQNLGLFAGCFALYTLGYFEYVFNL